MTPALSLSMTEYCPCPTFSLLMSLVSMEFSHAAAEPPATVNCPMWEMSKMPQVSRTALCSSRMPVYCTGIFQPAKGTILAPSSTCLAAREVDLTSVSVMRRCEGYEQSAPYISKSQWNSGNASVYTLKRNSMTSPSLTTYSFPSMRSLPCSLAPALPPQETRSS